MVLGGGVISCERGTPVNVIDGALPPGSLCETCISTNMVAIHSPNEREITTNNLGGSQGGLRFLVIELSLYAPRHGPTVGF